MRLQCCGGVGGTEGVPVSARLNTSIVPIGGAFSCTVATKTLRLLFELQYYMEREEEPTVRTPDHDAAGSGSQFGTLASDCAPSS